MTTTTKPKKLTKIEIAKEITDTTKWIDGAQKELDDYDTNPLQVNIEQCSDNFRCRFIAPYGTPDKDMPQKISDFIKTQMNDLIKTRKQYRNSLIRSMSSTPRPRKKSTTSFNKLPV